MSLVNYSLSSVHLGVASAHVMPFNQEAPKDMYLHAQYSCTCIIYINDAKIAIEYKTIVYRAVDVNNTSYSLRSLHTLIIS